MAMEAKWKVAGSAGSLPGPVTLLVPSTFFTCCHLSLSTCGGREHAVSQAWHHAEAVKWDVSEASRERVLVLCMNKTLFSGVQPCVSVWVQEAEEANLKTGSATLVGNSYNQASTKTCWLCLLCTSDGFRARKFSFAFLIKASFNMFPHHHTASAMLGGMLYLPHLPKTSTSFSSLHSNFFFFFPGNFWILIISL